MSMYSRVSSWAVFVVWGCCVWSTDLTAQTVMTTPVVPSAATLTLPERNSNYATWRQWFREHRDSARPVPMPSRVSPVGPAADEDEVMIHNTATGETRVSQAGDHARMSSGFVPGSMGASGNMEGSEGSALDNYSELYRVSNSAYYPWRVACKLRIFNGGLIYIGSGMLIDPKHVITAGHCVYDRDNLRWVDQIQVIPAFDNWAEPYGDGLSAGMMSWSGWVNNGDVNYDMGIVELDRPVGAITGWHGYGYNNDDNWFYGPTFNNPSYPGCLDGGLYMYNWYGTVDVVSTYLLQVNRLGCGGMSGCAAYTLVSGSRIVFSNGSHQDTTLGCHWQCRITEAKFGSIGTFIAANTPSALDLVSMDCHAAPSPVEAGLPLTTFDHLIHNYSSASWTGTVTANVYLSTDDVISTSDLLIGSGGVTFSWGPLSSVLVNWQDPPTIPANTSTGDYYLGVIIDHSDYNNANNASSGYDAAPIHVSACPSIAQVSLLSPASATQICSGYSAQYCWHHVSNATTYRIQWDDNAGFTSPLEATTADTCILRSLTGTGTWYWHVRGESACRQASWSTSRTIVLNLTPGSTALQYPANGTNLFSGESQTYCWSNIINATGYAVQWADNVNFDPATQMNPADTCIAYTIVGTGTWYWRVAATRGSCFSNWTQPRNVILSVFQSPDVVLWMNGSTLRLAWSHVTGARTYSVQYSDTPNGTFNQLTLTPDTTITMSPDQLLRFYQVIAQHP